MKLLKLLKNIEILSSSADMETEITAVSYDSRRIKQGHLFVAITGYAADGHSFIPAAMENGAAVVLCECIPKQKCPYVQVASCREALAVLGANWYDHPSDKLTVIGVTGTNGKTSVTDFLKNVLERTLGAKVGLIGTIRNMIGDEVIETERTTPESFELQRLFAQMVQKGCTHAVMEVSSHALYLHRVDGIRFQVGVFTNLTKDHLDFHKTMEAYRQAKALLFTKCETGIFNIDDEAVCRTAEEAACKILTVSAKNTADMTAKNICLYSDHVCFDVVHKEQTVPVQVRTPGAFTVYNALSVLGTASALGIPLDKAADALKAANHVKGRMEVVPTPNKDYRVLIDYAHTPDALENVLRAVQSYCKGRVIAVFGCGGDRDATKRPEMGRIGVHFSDYAVITSDNPRTEDAMKIIKDILQGVDAEKDRYEVVENRRMAIRRAMDLAQKGDIVVLCGKGHETYQIIGKEKTHLDEREEVAQYLTETRK